MERMPAKKETRGSWTSPCRLSGKELAKESWLWHRSELNGKGGKGGKDGGKNSWQKGSGRKGGKGQEKGGKGDAKNVLDLSQDRTPCSLLQERRKQKPVRH